MPGPRPVTRRSARITTAESRGRLSDDAAPAGAPASAGWRTKTTNARAIEHPSRGAAEAEIEDLRRRYRTGARAFRVVRLYAPDGSVRVIDFAQEDRNAAAALRDVERATQAWD